MSEDYNEFKYHSVDKTFSAINEINETLSPQQWPILAFFLVLISQTLILVNRGNKHTHLLLNWTGNFNSFNFSRETSVKRKV